MRTQTLKTYTKKKMEHYLSSFYKQTFNLNKLLNWSKKDQRLAELSQAYFWTINDPRAERFSVFTNESFANQEDFLSSNQKYVSQFKDKCKRNEEDLVFIREKLWEMIEKMNLSLYRVSKDYLKTSQSNVSRFFIKKENGTLSYKKLSALYIRLNKELQSTQ